MALQPTDAETHLGCHPGQRRPSWNQSAEIRVGCSGWQYKHWRGPFYPADLPQNRWLACYASRFDTVEINNTFYRLPEATAFTAWKKAVPPGFLYAVKASRYLTHMKKLKDPAEPLERLHSRARKLGAALGPVLYQLPPNMKLNVERLESSSPRCRAATSTRSSFAIRAGMSNRCSNFSRAVASRSACTTWPGPPPG